MVNADTKAQIDFYQSFWFVIGINLTEEYITYKTLKSLMYRVSKPSQNLSQQFWHISQFYLQYAQVQLHNDAQDPVLTTDS
jgi:hypothetical protein